MHGFPQNADWMVGGFPAYDGLRRAGRVLLWLLGLVPIMVFAAPVSPPGYRLDQILIKPKPAIRSTAIAGFHAAQKIEVRRTFAGLGGLQVLRVPAGETVPGLIARYKNSGLVEFAEPDFLVRAAAIPNDPKFLDGTLWGLNNYGQAEGTPDADIDAPEAWELLNSASNIVVAVLDTGIRYTHEDLASNMWANPLDGTHGFDAFTLSHDPNDDNGHGTLIAGVLGAVGNNGKGVTGVAWRVQMMACKCLDYEGNGSDSTVIACLDFARTNGARLINASLDSSGYSAAVASAISAVRDAGIIVVASAGNNWRDLDAMPRYPACYDLDNIVSVAYTTRGDTLGPLSNFGVLSVDLAAPGDEVYSTSYAADDSYFPTNDVDGYLAGTSFAAAYVSGALALLLEKFPAENYQQTISRLLNTVDPLPDLAGKCVTGGRLNLHQALSPAIQLTPVTTAAADPFQLLISAGFNRVCMIETSTNLVNWYPVCTNTTSTNWTFNFTDASAASSPRRFYRAVSSP
jgi:subtilisin family serine protease